MNYRNAILAMIATTAAAAVATPAMAQSDPPFTGPYVAAIGGWDRMQDDHNHKDGFLYGGQAGYDLKAGNVRFGPEAEVTGSTQKDCDSHTGTSYCSDAGRDFFVGARAGYVVTPKALLYATAGYTNARYTQSVGAGPTLVSRADDHSGGRVGAGVEYAVTKAVFLKTEYRYSHYSDDRESIGRNQVIGGIGVRF